MNLRHLGIMIAGAALALVAVACSGDSGDTVVNTSASSNGISVSGVGRIAVAPDVVLLQLGVETEASTVSQARENAATSMQAVVNSLKANGVADKDIQTIQFTILPLYDYNGRIQTLRGYHVTNVVSARLLKVDDASKVIDAAAKAGGDAVVIRDIRFDVEDRAAAETNAREAAVDQAHERARQLADNAGVDLGKVLSISETSQQVYNAYDTAIRAPSTGGGDTSSPISAGELEVVISVNVVYGID